MKLATLIIFTIYFMSLVLPLDLSSSEPPYVVVWLYWLSLWFYGSDPEEVRQDTIGWRLLSSAFDEGGHVLVDLECNDIGFWLCCTQPASACSVLQSHI